MIILTFDGENVIAIHSNNGLPSEASAVVETEAEVEAFAKKYPGDQIMCSSTMDFPQDYTSDPALIAKVRRLRGPSPFP